MAQTRQDNMKSTHCGLIQSWRHVQYTIRLHEDLFIKKT